MIVPDTDEKRRMLRELNTATMMDIPTNPLSDHRSAEQIAQDEEFRKAQEQYMRSLGQ